jgi:hypothetical protein
VGDRVSWTFRFRGEVAVIRRIQRELAHPPLLERGRHRRTAQELGATQVAIGAAWKRLKHSEHDDVVPILISAFGYIDEWAVFWREEALVSDMDSPRVVAAYADLVARLARLERLLADVMGWPYLTMRGSE